MSLVNPLAPSLPRGLIARSARRGVARLILRPFDDAFDRRLPSETAGKVAVEDLGATTDNARHAVEYAPTAGRLFQAIMTALPIDPAEFTFVDYGSGKGRVLCLAARYPFRAVIGVEFSEALRQQSLANLAAAANWPDRRCGELSAVAADAQAWPVPGGPCVFYLYNPFGPPVLAGVLARMRESWLGDRRKMYVVYYNPEQRHLTDAADFLRPRQPPALCRAAVAMSPHDLALYETLDLA